MQIKFLLDHYNYNVLHEDFYPNFREKKRNNTLLI
jgi:hypothetical protein